MKYTVAGTGQRKANDKDFVGGFPKNVVVHFAAGQTTADITLNVVADSTSEHNETFKVTLSGASGASITTSTATGSILNDDVSGGADEEAEAELIAVADPLWAFVPPEYLTAEQLAVPIITWINGTPFVGDLAHDHTFEHEQNDWLDHHDDVNDDPFGSDDRQTVFVMTISECFGSNAGSSNRGRTLPFPELDMLERWATCPAQTSSVIEESFFDSQSQRREEARILDGVMEHWDCLDDKFCELLSS